MVEKITYFSVKKIHIYLYHSVGGFDQKLTLITINQWFSRGPQDDLKLFKTRLNNY